MLYALHNLAPVFAASQPVARTESAAPRPMSELLARRQQPVRQVFLDVDGTLIGYHPDRPDEYLYTDRLKQSLKALQNQGVQLVLSTGRSYGETQGFAKLLDIESPGLLMLTDRGCLVVKTPNTVLRRRTLPMAVVNTITRLLQSHAPDARPVFYVDGLPYAKLDAFDSAPSIPEHRLWPTPKRLIQPFEAMLTPFRLGYDTSTALPSKIHVMIPDKAQLDNLAAYYQKQLQGLCLVHVIHQRGILEFFPADVAKEDAIPVITAFTGLPLAQSASIGNSKADAGLATLLNDAGGVSIVMGESREDIRRVSLFETTSFDRDGAAYALEQLAQLNARWLQRQSIHRFNGQADHFTRTQTDKNCL